MATRVAFLATHPIQYHAPIFRELHQSSEIEFLAYFAQVPTPKEQGAGFGVAFEWDQPILQGYEHRVLKNVALSPSVVSFRGSDTPEIREQLKRDQIDILIINGWNAKCCLQGLWAAKRLGIPVIVRGENNNLTKRVWWKNTIHRLLLRQFNAFLYIGSANKEYLLSRGVSPHKLFFAPYCVDNAFFSSQAEKADRSQFRERFQIPLDAFCFLSCGKLEPKKHPVELIESFKAAGLPEDQCRLLIVGDGQLRQECEKAAGGSPAVHFAGFLNQSEIISAYVASDVLVLPSDSGETWGLVVNEAFATGRPAIVSSLAGSCRDLITDGETGFSFVFGEWSELTERMRDCYARRGESFNLGINAKRRIEEYSPKRAAHGFLEAIRFVQNG